MKKLILGFILIVFLTGALFLERSEKAWPLERSFISFLGTVTHHKAVSVTAIEIPLCQSQLSSQDVALALRAIVDFHPEQIVVIGALDDVSSKPFLILREAVATGVIQGVVVRFLTNESTISQIQNGAMNIHLMTLEDLLLRREERERGSIIPELEAIFSSQTILLGGPQIKGQAAAFGEQLEKKMVIMPPLGIEVVILLVSILLMFQARRLSWLDFLLLLLGFIFCIVALNAWTFQTRGYVFPLVMPSLLILFFFFGKLLSCTQKVKQ